MLRRNRRGQTRSSATTLPWRPILASQTTPSTFARPRHLDTSTGLGTPPDQLRFSRGARCKHAAHAAAASHWLGQHAHVCETQFITCRRCALHCAHDRCEPFSLFAPGLPFTCSASGGRAVPQLASHVAQCGSPHAAPRRWNAGMLRALRRQRRFARGTLAALPQAASSRCMGSSGFTVPQLASQVAQCRSPRAWWRWDTAACSQILEVVYRSFVCCDPSSVCGRHVHTQYSVRAVACKLLR